MRFFVKKRIKDIDKSIYWKIKMYQEKPKDAIQVKSFGEDIIRMVSFSAIGQVISILISPITTRLYSPGDYGVYSIFIAIYTSIVVIICARYEGTIVIAKDDDEAANQLAISLIFTLAISALMIPIFIFGRYIIASIFSEPKLTSYFWLMPFYLVVQGSYFGLFYWSSRNKRFTNLSIAALLSSIVAIILQLIAGYFHFGTTGLLLGNFFGTLAAPVTLFVNAWGKDHKFWISSISLSKIRNGILRYKNFPLIGTTSSFVNVFSQQIPVFLIGIFFSTTDVGYLNLTNRVLRMPSTFIGNAISHVFYQRASVAYQTGTLHNLIRKTYRQVLLLWVFPLLLLILAGPDLFELIFGKNWQNSGVYTSILSILTMVFVINTPIYSLISVFEKLGKGLVFDLSLMIVTILSFIIGGHFHSPVLSLLLYAISNALIYFIESVWLFKIAGIEIGWVIGSIINTILIAVPFLALFAVSKWFLHFNSLVLFIVCAFLISFYYLYVVWKEQDVREEFLNIIRGFGIKNKISIFSLKRK